MGTFDIFLKVEPMFDKLIDLVGCDTHKQICELEKSFQNEVSWAVQQMSYTGISG